MNDEQSPPNSGQEEAEKRPLSREGRWIARSWSEWHQILENWIAMHRPEPHDEYALRQLWFKEAKHYDVLWRRYRFYHRLLRVTLIVAGVLTPLLIQADATTLATVSGAIVGVAAGLEGFFNWGERFRAQQRMADRLKDEGTAFLVKQEPYGVDDKADLKLFREQLQEITKGHRRAYVAARGEHGRPGATAGQAS